MDLGRLFRFGTNTVENLLLRWPRYSFQPRTDPCISFRSIGHADQPTGPKILCARSRVFSPEPLFRFTFPIEIVRHRIQRSKFAGSKRLPDRLSGKCLAYYVIPPTLNRLFCLFFSTFSDSSFFFVRVLLLSSSNRQFFFSLSLSLSILFLFCDYTVVPSSWRFLAAGKKTWSTSFVRGFLSPSSARPIKGKVLAPGTRATLASPGTPGFGCVTLRSLFARLQEIPPTYSKISPQLNLH